MKVKRVIFLRPPLMFMRRLGHESPHPPVELLYLMGSLKDSYDVFLIDGQTGIDQVEDIDDIYQRCGLSDEQIIDKIRDLKPQVVCIGSMWVCQNSIFRAMAKLVKSISSDIKVIAGGLLASSIPKEIVQDENIDYLVVGEGEKVLPELLAQIEHGNQAPEIPGVYYMKDGHCICMPKKLIQDLDGLPFPAYQMVNLNDYKTAYDEGVVKYWPFIGILPTRGCSYACAFCSLPVVTNRTFRRFSVRRIIKEMVLLKEEYGIKEVHFYDANLLNDVEFARELFRTMIDEKVNLPWLAEAGLSIWELSEDLLELAIGSGMYRLDIPIESGNKRVRKDIMNKDLYEKKDVLNIIKAARRLNIERLHGYVIIGNPGESIDDIKDSLIFLNSIDLDYRGIRCANPFPGTVFFDICKENGYLVRNFSYDLLWFRYPSVETEEFDFETMQALIYADRALALIDRRIKSKEEARAEIFDKWGRRIGQKALVLMNELKREYRTQGGYRLKQTGNHRFYRT